MRSPDNQNGGRDRRHLSDRSDREPSLPIITVQRRLKSDENVNQNTCDDCRSTTLATRTVRTSDPGLLGEAVLRL